MSGKVAVIGAGSTGVAATKVLRDAGFTDIVCFERRDVIGGLWYFTEEKARWSDESSVNRATVINTSKEFMAFSDYPMPDHYPNFCHNTMVEQYFMDYMKHFGVEKYIRYNTEVLLVRKHSSFESTGRWEVISRDVTSQAKVTEIYDYVLIANGHHGRPHLPSFPGLDNFKGKTMHSKEFKDVIGCEGKRACVVGIGNSGGDITSELSKYCETFLSTRRGVWVLNRLAGNGLPWDITFHTRIRWWAHNLVPRAISNHLWKKALSKQVDHDLYGLTPLHEPDATHPTVNDELPNRIACGMVKVKPDIRRFTDTGIEFVDGSFEDNIELVVFATGYSVSYDFVEKSVLGNVKDNRLELYKHMWLPGLSKQTLAFLGTIQPLGALFPIAEMQTRLAARVFKGEVQLPSVSEMKKDFAQHYSAIRRRYVDSQRHTFQVDFLPYMDELAVLVGCKPNMMWYFLTDPYLWYHLLFGPGAPYQYRLQGPNTWSGARHTFLTVMDRIRKPFKTRPLPQGEQSSSSNSWFKAAVVMTLVSGGAYYGVRLAVTSGHLKLSDWTGFLEKFGVKI